MPPAWPPAGILAGLFLTTPPAHRGALAALAGLVLVAAEALHGLGLPVATALPAVTVAEALIVSRLMTDGTDRRAPTLLVDGDVSRPITGVAVGAGVAAAGYGLVDQLSDHGGP